EVVAPTLGQWQTVNEHRFPDHEAWHEAVATAVELGDIEEIASAQQEALEHAPLSEEDRRRARTVLRAWTRPWTTGQGVLAALGIRAGERQQAAQAIRIENAATGGTLTRTTADPLVVMEPTVHNARVLTSFHRLSKGTATLDDLARIRTLIDQVEAEVGV